MDLACAGSEHATLLGEKLARLGELRSRLGAPVPPGFAVTAAAFDATARDPAIADLVAAADLPDSDLNAIAEQIQARLQSVAPSKRVVKAIKSSLRPFERGARFAVRSSATGEDGELSFAGVHKSIMSVRRDHIFEAYREVVASLYSERALLYRRSHGQPVAGAAMAVGCMRMVRAVASGVLYTFDPNDPTSDVMLVGAAWGHGSTVVEGSGPSDRFVIARRPPHRVIEATVAEKPHQLVDADGRGLRRVAVSARNRALPSISEPALAQLASLALAVERHMRCPQDIEWALDEQATLWILQARPLRLASAPVARPEELSGAVAGHPILLQNAGAVACRGIAAGPVVVVTPNTSPASAPEGSVLVTQYPTPNLSHLLPSAAALIADSGSPTGHLAALAREHRVPALVATEVASSILAPDAVVTVDAEENVVYGGRVDALVRNGLWRADTYVDSREFRVLRRMLELVAPLHLRDPSSRRFAPERCRSYHDIIRFAHEKAVAALSDLSDFSWREARRKLRRVALDVPLGLSLIDLGGGVAADAPEGDVELQQLTCGPLAALLEALVSPGVWSTRPADLDLSALVSSATRSASLTEFGAAEVRRNLAIVSDRYMNLSLFLGYHFNVIDCYLGEGPEDSYMLFRFVGGISEAARRERRAGLLEEILSHHGFAVERTGDLVIARLAGVSAQDMELQLRMTGRLIGFTRQLDVLLRSEEIVRRLVDAFVAGGKDPTQILEGPRGSPPRP